MRCPRGGPYTTLQLGIGMTEWFIDWCQTAEWRLAEKDEDGKE